MVEAYISGGILKLSSVSFLTLVYRIQLCCRVNSMFIMRLKYFVKQFLSSLEYFIVFSKFKCHLVA